MHAVEIRDVILLRNDRPILDGVSWSVRAGEQAAILGPNGSGKSTLTRVLMGYLWPSRGEVSVLGRRFGETNLNELRTLVRLVQPNGPFELDPALTVRDGVFTGYEGTLGVFSEPTPHQVRHVEEMIDRVGLSRVASSPYGQLSTGERLRTQLARALVVKPAVLILDEPTAGLDIRGREELLLLVDQLSESPEAPAVLMVTHHVEELPLRTTNVLLLDDGRVAAKGAPDAVLTSASLSRVYRCPVDVTRRDGRFYLHATGKPL